ncbi:Uncharacterised protein [Pseudomonas putida]|nr:Uncharacterised protein [Pseudomonas putida]
MNDSAPVNAVGKRWMALYSNTYIKPVCTMPKVTRLASAGTSPGNPPSLTHGASNSAPVATWISAIRCGGVPLRRLMINAAMAYRKAAPSASAMPSK